MDAKVALSVPFTEAETKFLESQALSYGLPDAGKALRCCINWSAQAAVGLDIAPSDAAATSMSLHVAQSQSQYLQSIAMTWNVDPGLVARAIVLAAMKAPPDEVFQVVRCKSRTTCPNAPVV